MQETPTTPGTPERPAGETTSGYDKQELTNIVNRMHDQDPFVADEAVRDLEEIGAPAVPVLIEKLTDPRAEMRYRACQVLAELRDARAVDALIDLLKIRDIVHGTSVASVAAKALGRLADQKAVAHLLPLIDSEDKELRYNVIRALGFLRATQAGAKLVARLKDKDATFFDALVRCAAAEALGRIKHNEAIPELAALLDDNAEETYTGLPANYYAARALERITGETQGSLTRRTERPDTIAKWQEWWKKRKAAEEKKPEKQPETPPQDESGKGPPKEPK
jgi:HEAT repeat protein